MKKLLKYDLRFFVCSLLLSLFIVGCSDDEAVDPTGDFTYEVDANNTMLVHFTANANNGRTLAWDFGDGNYSIAKNTSHEFSAGGTYNVKLIIYGEDGSTPAETIQTVTVIQHPTANFNFTIDDLTVTFTAITTGADSFVWDFGDGNTSNDKNPVHTYGDYGSYTVTLIATGQVGSNPATVNKTVNVEFNAPVFELVTVENADLELPGSGNRIKDWASIPGWSSDNATVDSGVEKGGWWQTDSDYAAVLFTGDSSAYNLTSHVIAEGEEFKLQLNGFDIWNGPKLVVTIYYDNGDGNRNVLATKTVDLTPGEWNAIELLATATPASVGANLGIEFSNISADGGDAWTSFDDIRLFALK